MTRPRMVFRADASTRLGSGHIMRCLTLSVAAEAGGWSSAFACAPGTQAALPSLEGLESLLQVEGPPLDQATAMTKRWGEGCDVLVVDHYGLGAVFEAACRPWAGKILVIDDLADRAHDADFLLDQTFGRTLEAYQPLVSANCRLLLGSSLALLRPQFNAARGAALARRSSGLALQRVLVALGSADPEDLTSRVLEALEDSGLQVEVDLILSRAAPRLEAVQRKASEMALEVRVHVDTSSVASLVGAADLAIGAGGTSCWERCCLGLPALLFVVADNQRATAAALAAHGAAVNMGWHEDVDVTQIARELRRLATDLVALQAMSDAAATVTDGLGANRVLEALA